jgi:hypothetical protein
MKCSRDNFPSVFGKGSLVPTGSEGAWGSTWVGVDLIDLHAVQT